MSQCGAGFPSNFYCPAFASCNSLASDDAIAICCPRNQDCSTLKPIDCDAGSSNATDTPWKDLLSSTPVNLSSCGKACCPPTYTCRDDQCVLHTSVRIDEAAGRGPRTTGATASTLTTTRRTRASPASTQTSKTALRAGFSKSSSAAIDPTATRGAHAGGFIGASSENPGLSPTTIALIGVLAALVFLTLLSLVSWSIYKRRKQRENAAITEEKVQGSKIQEARLRDIELLCKKAELDGIPRVLLVPPRELDTTGEPKELAAIRPKRPRTLNSVRQELEVDTPTVATTLWI